MLKIFFGDMSDAVYNTASYFKYDYEDEWIVDLFVKEMIEDVDKSTVLDSGVIDSPVLGKRPCAAIDRKKKKCGIVSAGVIRVDDFISRYSEKQSGGKYSQ